MATQMKFAFNYCGFEASVPSILWFTCVKLMWIADNER